jgi:hypothetical protein
LRPEAAIFWISASPSSLVTEATGIGPVVTASGLPYQSLLRPARSLTTTSIVAPAVCAAAA